MSGGPETATGVEAGPAETPEVKGSPRPRQHRILLTGATGYIGGRLLPRLEEAGEIVRCMARRPEHLRPRVGPETEVVRGDVLDPESLQVALDGVDVAYYLIHSMGDAEDFEQRERRGAINFAEAARTAGVRRIVYLGGLGRGGELSPHLASRHEVGRLLRDPGVPTIELRASVIIGSGSLSFEMIRALVNRLPIMVTPRWVETTTQPIAVEDVIEYLLAARDLPGTTSRIYEIGGPDRVTYGDLMREFARQRGLRRLMIPVPVLTPWLSSLWLGLVTPLYARVGRKLLESIVNETVVEDPSALHDFDVRPRGVSEAIRRALDHEDRDFAATRWSDALSSVGPAGGAARPWGGTRFGTRRIDSRTARVGVPPSRAFAPIRRIGGATGWYFADWLWALRGFLDLLAGGAGGRRGRRDPEKIRVGDAIDFWRVEAYEPDSLLRLRAEMRLPGRAWLQFEVEPLEPGDVARRAEGGESGSGSGDGGSDGRPASRIRQTAIFDPIGLGGLLYWYAVWPLHALVFRGMLRGVAEAARAGPPLSRPAR